MKSTSQVYSRHAAALDDAAIFSAEHQRHLANASGGTPQWRTRSDGILEFLTPRGVILPARTYPIGTTNADNTTWTWAWGSGDDNAVSDRIRKFGINAKYSLFTRPTIELSHRDSVSPLTLVTCTKVIHRVWYHLRLPNPDGSSTYTALHIPALPLPDPTWESTRTAVEDAQSLLRLRRPRRAAASYANLRQLTRYETRDGRTIRLVHPGWTLDLIAGNGKLDISQPGRHRR